MASWLSWEMEPLNDPWLEWFARDVEAICFFLTAAMTRRSCSDMPCFLSVSSHAGGRSCNSGETCRSCCESAFPIHPHPLSLSSTQNRRTRCTELTWVEKGMVIPESPSTSSIRFLPCLLSTGLLEVDDLTAALS